MPGVVAHATSVLGKNPGYRNPSSFTGPLIDALQREDELVLAQTDAALATVKLYLALGGGWAEGDDATAAPMADANAFD
ncbi:hypothetical protein [Paraburkholderia mimosarum]|uniref:hypothetical protein n=1 Tax=Paraburkholderia mimosarum TaxID=312026 RepID=UPI0009DDB85E|nr:hypothetical protein [Paraburkholderia mimosarum]